MKQNTTISLCYFIYLSLAVFINPVEKHFNSRSEFRAIEKEEVSIAKESPEISHGELLFRY